MAAATVAAAIAGHKVLIFSKTYCPYCVNAKAAFKTIGVSPTVIEVRSST
jgi:glutaredoxin 3